MPLNENTPVYPGDPQPSFNRLTLIEKDGHNTHRICINNHFGTHIDAPWHMLQDGKRLGEFPINKFVSNAVLFDVRGQGEIDVDLYGVREHSIILLRTDHTKYISSPDFFETNPVVSKKFADKIVKNRLNIVGIDSYTIDNAPFEIHKYLFQHDILVLENLINLDKINARTFRLIILPLKLDNIDGAPCRVVASVQ